MNKRTKIRIRRWLCLLSVAIGAACAWQSGGLIVHNAIHGCDRLPQLAGVLVTAWLMSQAVGWLGGAP